MTAPPPRHRVSLVTGGFFLTGVVSVLLGPLIPELTAAWGVGYGETGRLFIAQFTGSSVGALVSSFDLRRSLVGGYALAAVGLLLLTAGGWAWAWVAMAVVGLGLGLVIPASNLWTAHAFPERRGSALSLLNLAWGLGATLCPLLFAALLGHAPAAVATAGIAGLAALTAALLSAARVGGEVSTDTEGAEAEIGAPPTPTLALVAAILFLYVGAENAVGGWLVAFADRLTGDRSVIALLIGSGFWGALLLGRLLTPWWLRLLSEARLYSVSLAVAGAGTLGLTLADGRGEIAAGALVAGLGLAALFPLTVSLLAERTGTTGSRGTGWVFAFCGLGGATLPWLAGRVAETGDPGRAFWVPVAALVVLAGVHGWVRRSETQC